ncbi:MAG: methyltransferase domain-containing protein [Desulfonatronovibrio sp.]
MDKHGPSLFLKDHLDLIMSLTGPGPVLDLACGRGHNGLFLAKKGLEVHFWDVSQEKLEGIEAQAAKLNLKASTRQVDLESGNTGILPLDFYRLVMVFKYLHRPLMTDIKNSVQPGGTVIYETFTTEQARIGKPENPDFLLKKNELLDFFHDWCIVDHYQGRFENPQRYMAGIIARKV